MILFGPTSQEQAGSWQDVKRGVEREVPGAARTDEPVEHNTQFCGEYTLLR